MRGLRQRVRRPLRTDDQGILPGPDDSCRVESRRSAVAYRTGGAKCARRLSLLRSPRSPSLRFSSPLIEPGMQISRTRLSDGFHVKACAETSGRTGDRIRETGRPASQTHLERETAELSPRTFCTLRHE